MLRRAGGGGGGVGGGLERHDVQLGGRDEVDAGDRPEVDRRVAVRRVAVAAERGVAQRALRVVVEHKVALPPHLGSHAAGGGGRVEVGPLEQHPIEPSWRRGSGAHAALGKEARGVSAASPAPGRLDGMLLKRSNFYATAAAGRVGTKMWGQRYFVLDDNAERPLRYAALGGDGHPSHRYTAINFWAITCVDLVTPTELHIVTLEAATDAAAASAGAAQHYADRLNRGDARYRRASDATAALHPSRAFARAHSMPEALLKRQLLPPPAEEERELEGEGEDESEGEEGGGAQGEQSAPARARGRRGSVAKWTQLRAAQALGVLKPKRSNSVPHSKMMPHTEYRYELRLMPGAKPGRMQEWFDALVVQIDAALQAEDVEQMIARHRKDAHEVEDEHEVWWECPASPVGRLLFALTLPLKAAVHLTTYDVKAPAYVDYYPAALAASLGWLVVLAMLMTSCLDAIGCIIDFSETVMGLTLGAMGTSFPNLYASVLVAQRGEAGMAVTQAFASNNFNVCVALGMLWLLQALGGRCAYVGGDGTPIRGSHP
eukprot:Transcript_13000.p2 GENE.Transcript_13000~~Transcript_13000.p2  ORF type:complete len:545 (-),score=221.94 Transcript_13000:495-2129(-)